MSVHVVRRQPSTSSSMHQMSITMEIRSSHAGITMSVSMTGMPKSKVTCRLAPGCIRSMTINWSSMGESSLCHGRTVCVEDVEAPPDGLAVVVVPRLSSVVIVSICSCCLAKEIICSQSLSMYSSSERDKFVSGLFFSLR